MGRKKRINRERAKKRESIKASGRKEIEKENK